MQGVNLGKASKPSGFQLMVSLLNDTPILRMLLSIVDDIGQLLEKFVSNEGLWYFKVFFNTQNRKKVPNTVFLL